MKLAPRAALAASALWLAAVAAPAAAQTPAPYQQQFNYDPFALPSDPEWDETLAQITYPPGHGPVSQGYPAAPRPVFLTLRGGNSNSLVPGLLVADSPNDALTIQFGFASVLCNFPVLQPGEDYETAAAGVRLLVQYLRANAADLNIDPDRVFVQGRSFGCIVGYAISLKHDAADPNAAHPQLQQSSRPNFFAPRFGPSNLTCFSQEVDAWTSTMNLFFFPGEAFVDTTPEQRLAESSTWWLVNPQLFGRERTPPMCIAYFETHPDVCGETIDVHSGVFGDAMIESVEQYVRQTGDVHYLEQLGTVNMSVESDPLPGIVGWSTERLAEGYGGLLLVPPAGSLTDPGSTITLGAFFGEPGSTITFYTGTQPGPLPVPGCPTLQDAIGDASVLGAAVTDPAGLAALQFAGNPAAIGQDALFHAVDTSGCAASNVVVHRWY